MSGGKENKIPPRAYKARRDRFELLAAWYGSQRAAVEIAAHTGQPAAIGELLDKVFESAKDKDGGTIVTLRTNWRQITGQFADFTEPEKFENGILSVTVRHSALVMELSHSKDIFIDAVNRALGRNICTDLKFTASSGYQRKR